ncbi:autotransporter outer membrane beta-barrel domain-containing protein [Loktanella sp. Alg231-35]|uniref:autotransporter outer membrane beta-barrel domain-containing protein n=1 Tax=Loktanella sp. Alg231-35 TaxID=1922220 RepID=UPI00131ED94E|nr:autotransporter outer membrane beta-barrel domain-containing protein [Loktanella sp. Alg231-35]
MGEAVSGLAGDDTFSLLSGSAGSVDAGSGSDTITLDGATVTGNLGGGLGEDLITVTSGSVDGFVLLGRVNGTSTDDDTLVMSGGMIAVDVRGDNGNDTITLTGGNIGRNVDARSGTNTITLDGTSVAASISAGGGDDTFSLLSGSAGSVDAGSGSDTITLDGATVTGDLLGGIGQDLITANSGSVGGSVILGRNNGTSTEADTFLMTGGAISTDVRGDLGDDTITLNGGTVGRDVNANSGNDTIVLDGGTIGGEVIGGDGEDDFTWTSGTMAGFDGGDGSDLARVTATEYDGSQMLDGGDDASLTDGYIDSLALDGVSVTTSSALVRNWESIQVLDGTVDFGPNLTVGSGRDLGLIAGVGGIISSSGNFSLTGDLVTLDGGIYQSIPGNASMLSVSGNIRNSGEINVQDGAAGDSITTGGSYSGAGALLLDVDFAGDTADTLTIAGDVIVGGTTVVVADVSTGTASGNDILLVDVMGATGAGDFQLDGGTVRVGSLPYLLELVDSQWFLLLDFLPSSLVSEAYPKGLDTLNKLVGHSQRVRNRAWLAGGDPFCGSHEVQPTDRYGNAWPCSEVGVWMKLSGSLSGFDPKFSTIEADLGTSIDYDISTMKYEFGVDTTLADDDNGRLVGGMWVYFGSASLSGAASDENGKLNTDGFGVGASLTWYDESSFYVDAQLQYSKFESDLSTSGSFAVSDNRGSGLAASIEVGKTYALSPALSITPEAQVMYYDLNFDSYVGETGDDVYLEDGTTTEIRLGGTFNYRDSNAHNGNDRLYVSGNVFHYLDDMTVVNSAGTRLVNKQRPWRGEIGLGASHEWTGVGNARMAIFADVTAGTDFGTSLSSGRTLKGSIGFKMEF